MTRTLEADNLINGYRAPQVVKAITVGAGTYLRGMAIGEVSGAFKQIGEATYTVDTIYAIVAETTTLTEEGKIEVYLTGEFNKDCVFVKEGTTVENLVIPGRKLGLFIS